MSRKSIGYVIANHQVHFEEEPPRDGRGHASTRLVYLGRDADGRLLEVMAVVLPDERVLVIHAMPLRPKYRGYFEEVE